MTFRCIRCGADMDNDDCNICIACIKEARELYEDELDPSCQGGKESKMSDGAFYYVPTFVERLWKRLGFIYHLGEEPEGSEQMSGWMRSDVRIKFCFRDRLRLLTSGNLHVVLVQHTTAQIDECLNRVDWQIEPPAKAERRTK